MLEIMAYWGPTFFNVVGDLYTVGPLVEGEW